MGRELIVVPKLEILRRKWLRLFSFFLKYPSLSFRYESWKKRRGDVLNLVFGISFIVFRIMGSQTPPKYHGIVISLPLTF